MDTEKAIYRLSTLGIIDDYTVNFSSNTFTLFGKKKTEKEEDNKVQAPTPFQSKTKSFGVFLLLKKFCLTITSQAKSVVLFPVLPTRRTDEFVSPVPALAEASVLTARTCEPSALAALVNGVGDPLNTGVVPDSSMLRVDQDYFEILVGRVSSNPVRVQHAQVAASAASLVLCANAKGESALKFVDTVVLGLTVYDTLAVGPLASAAAHSHAVHHVALLGLVPEPMGLLRAGRPVHAVHLGQVAVLPPAHAQQKAHHIALLFAPDLLEVLVRAHPRCSTSIDLDPLLLLLSFSLLSLPASGGIFTRLRVHMRKECRSEQKKPLRRNGF
jgi:hypothetical protein